MKRKLKEILEKSADSNSYLPKKKRKLLHIDTNQHRERILDDTIESIMGNTDHIVNKHNKKEPKKELEKESYVKTFPETEVSLSKDEKTVAEEEGEMDEEDLNELNKPPVRHPVEEECLSDEDPKDYINKYRFLFNAQSEELVLLRQGMENTLEDYVDRLKEREDEIEKLKEKLLKYESQEK